MSRFRAKGLAVLNVLQGLCSGFGMSKFGGKRLS